MQATPLRVLGASLCLAAAAPLPARAEPRFEGYDIRVIRPRYFVKEGHVELAAGLASVMNQTFVYSLLATGLLTWQATETLGLELQGAYGKSFDRQDKTTLADDFAIHTIVLRPESMANARVVWTPSYGKFNLGAARVVYFDTHVTLGAGTTGVRYLYEHCEDPADVPEAARSRVTAPPAPRTFNYPTAVLGAGQRYFLDQHSSLRIGLELQRYWADSADGECSPGADSVKVPQDDLLLLVAWSYYL
jgi:outer membrane beta-barrel protein